MKTNLEARFEVAMADAELAAEILAAIEARAAISAQAETVLKIVLADDKAGADVATVLKAKETYDALQAIADDARDAADADPLDLDLEADAVAAEAAAADALAAIKPLGADTKARITVALADDKAGAELIAKIEA